MNDNRMSMQNIRGILHSEDHEIYINANDVIDYLIKAKAPRAAIKEFEDNKLNLYLNIVEQV